MSVSAAASDFPSECQPGFVTRAHRHGCSRPASNTRVPRHSRRHIAICSWAMTHSGTPFCSSPFPAPFLSCSPVPPPRGDGLENSARQLRAAWPSALPLPPCGAPSAPSAPPTAGAAPRAGQQLRAGRGGEAPPARAAELRSRGGECAAQGRLGRASSVAAVGAGQKVTPARTAR